MSLKRMFCCFEIGSSSSSGAAEVPEDLLIRSSSSRAAEVSEDLLIRSSSSSGAAQVPKDSPIRSSYEIPEDLVIEILLRVPANLITKFSRLSKFYRDSIDSPDFIRRQCNLSIKRTHTMCWCWNDAKIEYRVVNLDSTKFGARVEKSINSFISSVGGYSIEDSCVGILCLLSITPAGGAGDGHILLWNPVTGGRRIIGVRCDNNAISRCYLGHDAATDDLKILKITLKNPFSVDPPEYQCEIYSYRIGSWRNISDNNNWPVLNYWHGHQHHSHRIFVEGTSSLHTVDPTDKSILTFDFSLEKFNRVALPRACSVAYDCSLLDLDGCRCIVGFGMPCEACTSPCCLCIGGFHMQARASPCLSVWGMKEYGVKESWTWLFCVHDFVRSSFPEPFWPQFVNGGRQLLLMSKESGQYKLHLYDLEHKKMIKYCGNEWISQSSVYRPYNHFLYIPSLRQVGQFCCE